MRRSTFMRAVGLAALVAALAIAGGSGHAASNTVYPGSAIALNDCCNNSGAVMGTPSTAATYPSTINVPAGLPSVGHAAVTVVLDAKYPDDIQLLLVSPSNAKVLLMANVGGDAGNAITPDTLVFDDAGGLIPDTLNTQLQSGTYKPTAATDPDCDNQGNPTNFPATGSPPAPPGPYASTLGTFNGGAAQGAWKLYAIDDCNLANVGGSIVSWSINLTGPTAVTVTVFTAQRASRGVQLRWRTVNEAQALGYNVYRSAAGKLTKVNRSLIAARHTGMASGAAYSLVDRRTARAYRLQVVDTHGKRAWAAAAVVSTAR
jgi:subtilisin-like proprotein convertase family protein